jgi:hypothetical protein
MTTVKKRKGKKPHKEGPVIIRPIPLENSHGERLLKCTFCDRPAVTVVKGYPVCQEHADMLYREAESAAVAGREPVMKDHAPPMETGKAKGKTANHV